MPTRKPMATLVARTLRNRIPLDVHFDLTYRCNERCIHCYLEHSERGELTAAEVKNIFDQLREAGTLFLTLSGGEIFLRDDIFVILEHARQLHFDLSIKTNATLLDAAKVKRLKALGVRRVQVSIYSADATVHDGITRMHGSLQRSLAAIALLQGNDVNVKIACPVMTNNRHRYTEIIELANELGITYCIDPTISPSIDGDLGLLKLRTAADELLPILAAIPKEVRAAEKQRSAIPTDGNGTQHVPCGAGHNSVYLSPYGEVYPCVQMPIAAGNLRRQSFRQIWHGSDDMTRVRAFQQDAVCGSCSVRQYCHRCPGLAWLEKGDACAPHDRACEMAEARARLAGEVGPRSALHLESSSAGG